MRRTWSSMAGLLVGQDGLGGSRSCSCPEWTRRCPSLVENGRALIATSAHAAGPEAGRWSMSLIGGVDVPVNGDVHDGATAIVPDLGPLNPALAGVDAELRIGARVGATRVDEIRATFEIPDAGITIADAPFYDSGWLASGGLDVGVIVPFGETFSMTLASGVRYT